MPGPTGGRIVEAMTSTSTSSPTTSATPSPAPTDSRPATLQRVARELKTAALITIGFGLVFALGSHSVADGIVRLLGDTIFLRSPGTTSELADVHHLTDAILGGVMAGWGVMIWMLADRVLPLAPAETKRILVVSMLVWFSIDTAGSIASGGWMNAVLNVGFLAMFVVPVRRI